MLKKLIRNFRKERQIKAEMLDNYKMHYRDRSRYETFLQKAESEYPFDCLRIQILGALKDVLTLPLQSRSRE